MHYTLEPLKIYDVSETYALADAFASTLKGGEVVLLNGDLGAGKTTFTKGLAKALGIKQEVTSPTFTIANIYEDGRLPLVHVDMYRLENADEIYETGVEDQVGRPDGVTVIEWNKFENLHYKLINVNISVNEDGTREFKIAL